MTLADIKKAFLQVGIQELDRDVTRFLWFKEISDILVSDVSVDAYRFCHAPFGIVCSPFLLAGTLSFTLNNSRVLLLRGSMTIFMLIM